MIALAPTVSSVLGAITWDPGFRGLLTVAVGVIALCGSVALIVSTNTGARLGFLIAITALSGWMVVMGLVWSMYGIGPKGPAPSWDLVEGVRGAPAGANTEVARQLPAGRDSNLPDPLVLRQGSKEIQKEFPAEGRNPTLGDIADLDPKVADQINKEAKPWKLLPTSSGYTGELQAAVAEYVGPDGLGLFNDASEFVYINSYTTGGKTPRTEKSIVGRIKHKITSTLQIRSKPFYAAVQIQAVVPQEAKPGQAPPLPVADRDAPVYTVVLHRDRGALRLPSITTTVFSAIVFGVCANSLHRRDKLAQQQRAAEPAGAS